VVEVKNVSKRYGGVAVVDDVSLSIAKGKITSFIGPNGAGKSTLLSMISRLITKDAGEVLIEGKEIGSCKSNDLARKISVLKQSNHISVRLTVKELVSFGRFPYSQGRLTAEDKAFIDEAISYMDLKEMQDKYIDQLSGGQRQRAYIAMVMAQDTDYILLDEPLNNLDMKHSVQIMKVLRRLVDERGKTIILVIHDINFASCYSDFIVALKNGRVAAAGTADEIIDSAVLGDVYDMDIPIEIIGGKKIGIYFGI
jgi:iron complex transport system ATP-binding protein